MMKRFKIALVGCGSMAGAWAKYAMGRSDCQIVSLVDLVPENAHRLAEQYKIECSIYNDLKEAAKYSNPNLLFDITVPDAHRTIVTTALELGCDVLGEKPMASSMEDSIHMLKVAQKLKKSYAIMQNRRYLKNIRELRMMLANGVIGCLLYTSPSPRDA